MLNINVANSVADENLTATTNGTKGFPEKRENKLLKKVNFLKNVHFFI